MAEKLSHLVCPNRRLVGKRYLMQRWWHMVGVDVFEPRFQRCRCFVLYCIVCNNECGVELWFKDKILHLEPGVGGALAPAEGRVTIWTYQWSTEGGRFKGTQIMTEFSRDLDRISSLAMDWQVDWGRHCSSTYSRYLNLKFFYYIPEPVIAGGTIWGGGTIFCVYFSPG